MTNEDQFADVDVVVVGAGNAASVAALSARQQGARVVVLEAAPPALRGGNSAFTGGAFRFAYNGVEDLQALAPDMNETELADIDFGTYTEEQFFDDMARMSQFRCDPDLTAIVVKSSYQTARWMTEQGIRLHPAVGRQAFKVDGKFRFWGGLALHINGGGQQLVQTLHECLEQAEVPILYETPAVGLLYDGTRVEGVRVRQDGVYREIKAKSVVLACGSFESNAEMRARYLGPGWDLAKVRGTKFNQGAGLKMAMEIGAAPYGHWSGSHAVAWDLNAPAYGDITVGDQFQKHNVPFSIMVNAKGERFRDEGSDFHSYTYAKYGGEILQQPGMFAWQIFDQQVTHLLRSEYRISRITKVTADSIEELAPLLEGVDPDGFIQTVRAFNAAIDTSIEFDPNVKDGRRTNGLVVDKTNWANPLVQPPFEAYAVTAGVTFAFGGLKVRGANAQVEDTSGNPIAGLYACGEMVGGLYYHNYASGTGLMAGSVFGRIAGEHAATDPR